LARQYPSASSEPQGQGVHAAYLSIMHQHLSDHLSLSAAWDVQVAGKANDEPGHLDLQNFERHQAKLKLIAQF
jgi:hypothetical protein